MTAPLTPEGFAAATGVSRETLDRLMVYEDLLAKWNQRINLVSRGSLTDVWRRHLLDSAQLFDLAPSTATDGAGLWLDLGSGAGFPALVVAIMGAPAVHAVESDSRKCVFLQEAARMTGAPLTVHNSRIEVLPPMTAAVISARALAPLPRLLELAAPHLMPETTLLFPKGQDVADELTEASKCWSMRAEQIPSITDVSGVVLRLKEVTHVGRWSEG